MTSPMCPWCGHEVDDAIDLVDFDAEGKSEMLCGRCDRPVIVWRFVWTNYAAEKREEPR